MFFLPVLASKAELTAGYGGIDLRHGSLIQVQHRLDRRDRVVQPLSNLAVCRFQTTRARGFTIERGSQSRAIKTKSLHLSCKPFFVTIGLFASFDCGIERVECEREAPDCRVDCALLRHCLRSAPKTLAAADV